MAFLDADCVAPPDWIARIRAEFDKESAPAALGGLYDYPPCRSFVDALCRMEGIFIDKARTDPAADYPQGGNMAVRRDVWETARSGREGALFAGMAGGEDRFVWDELRKSVKVEMLHSLGKEL